MQWSSRSFTRHFTLSRSKFALNVVLGLLFRLKLPFQLGVFYRSQDFAEKRSRPVTHLEEIVPGKQSRGPDQLRRRLRQCAADKSVRLKPPVAGEAVEPVQLQMLLKSRQPKKAFQRRGPHLFDVLEPHVVGYQRYNLLGVVVREAQALGNFLRHAHPNVDVPIEPDSIARLLSGL